MAYPPINLTLSSGDSEVQWLTIPGIPKPKERPRIGRHGNVYTPKDTTNYENTVKKWAIKRKIKKIEGHIAGMITFYLPDRRVRDLDNIVKGVMDALQKIAWDNDANIGWIENKKGGLLIRKALDKENPRAELVFWKA